MNQINQPNVNASGGVGGAGGHGGGGGGGGGSGGTVVFAQVSSPPAEEISQKVANLQKRISVLEFIIALAFSICFVLIYAILKIQSITLYSPIIYYGLYFFFVSFLSIQFLLYLVNAFEKVGGSFKKIIEEWKSERTINKLGIFLGLLSSLSVIYSIIKWIIDFVGNI